MAFKIFLSYTSCDSDLVEKIKDTIKSIDMIVYAYEDHPQAGSNLPDKLVKEINSSDALIALLTIKGSKRPTILMEIGCALSRNKRIIPVVEEGIDYNDYTFLANIEYVQLKRSDPTSALRALKESLKLHRTEQTSGLDLTQPSQGIEEYLTHLENLYNFLDLTGMSYPSSDPIRLPLVDIYVPLKARLGLHEKGISSRNLYLAGRPISSGEIEDIGPNVSEPISLLDLIRENNILMILGDPGTGKTTFLRYLAIRLARGDNEALGLEQYIPVLLPFSVFDLNLDENLDNIDYPYNFISAYCRKRGVVLPINTLLRCPVLFMFDGLDEIIDQAKRNQILKEIIQCAIYDQKSDKFIFTSRIINYRNIRPSIEKLVECTLVDLGEDEIDNFIKRWFEFLIKATSQGDLAYTSQKANREYEELMEIILHNQGVRHLATNPLLLTLLALMKSQTMKLPERRVELYEKCVKTLLNHWSLVRTTDSQSWPIDDIIKVLASLAYWMHKSNPTVGLVTYKDLCQQLENIWENLGIQNPKQATEKFLTNVRNNVCLLLERGLEQYGFSHLTFQEYLAAIAITQKAECSIQQAVEELISLIGDDRWREVILLTIAHLAIYNEKVCHEIVEQLIKAQTDDRAKTLLVIGDAVLDAWPQDTPKLIKENLTQILIPMLIDESSVKPIMRAKAGEILAYLGDTRTGVGILNNGLPDIAWCSVHSGSFKMGSDSKEKSITPHSSEFPQIEFNLSTYDISRYPVTNIQFETFIKDGGYTPKWRSCWTVTGWRWKEKENKKKPRTFDENSALSNHPVVMVTWYEAVAFCNWLTIKFREAELIVSNQKVRLPSEKEWEKAARGTDGRHYPWGNFPDPNKANYDDTKIRSTSTVGCFPGGVSPYGCEDMAGNVWEWCSTKWREDYYDYTDDNDIQGDFVRVARGGSFYEGLNDIYCARRFRFSPDKAFDNFGFRIVLFPVMKST